MGPKPRHHEWVGQFGLTGLNPTEAFRVAADTVVVGDVRNFQPARDLEEHI
jgi:hypothetical protein